VLQGEKFADGVIVTQVVPAVSGYSRAVLDYKTALAKYFPGETPDYVSFEGYVAAKILVEALRRAGPQPDTEKLIDTLEGVHDLDMGLETLLNFGPSKHQASHKVWGTQLDKKWSFPRNRFGVAPRAAPRVGRQQTGGARRVDSVDGRLAGLAIMVRRSCRSRATLDRRRFMRKR